MTNSSLTRDAATQYRREIEDSVRDFREGDVSNVDWRGVTDQILNRYGRRLLRCSIRDSSFLNSRPTGTSLLHGHVGTILVVAMAGRHVYIYVRKIAEPVQKQESTLKFMTRAVACMVHGKSECLVSNRNCFY